MKEQSATFIEHDCRSWRNQVWENSAEYNLIKCMICDRITHFAFKSLWMRIKFLFWGGVNS